MDDGTMSSYDMELIQSRNTNDMFSQKMQFICVENILGFEIKFVHPL
jgi:hypothetical protein